MIVYDMAEQIESPKKMINTSCRKNIGRTSLGDGGFLHVITPTRIGLQKSTVAPVVFQRVFAYHRSQYSRYSAIYTNGSKRADYVGCGVVIEDIMHGFRLHTSCSIFTTEVVAIYRALQLIDSICPVNTASILTA
ncbi:pggt1b [Trichonephila clavipes]|nr:pggt1b [Trichonephila clavipes]